MIKYFGYGSNMDFASLRAKGVVPSASRRAALKGWRLRFNVEHFFRHEGGVGNIEHTGDPADEVLGVLHCCDEDDLAALDRVEAYGIGYDRIDVDLETSIGLERGLAYIGLPRYVNQECLPTRRYLNILVRGAIAAKIDHAYVDMLKNHPVLEPLDLPPFEPAATQPPLGHSDLEPPLTALAGHVFDMSNARAAHDIPRDWFGGKDVTVFHLRRMDSSDGTEGIEDVIDDRLSTGQRAYLNRYLHAFDEEYDYVGRFDYASLPPEKQFGSKG